MGLEQGTQLLETVFMNSSVFGTYLIYQLMFLFGSLVIITRNWKNWSALALPVITGWHMVGFRFNYIFFIIAGIVMIIHTLSLKEVVGGLEAIGGGFKALGEVGSGVSYKPIKRWRNKRREEWDKRVALKMAEMEKEVKNRSYKIKPKIKPRYEKDIEI